jgi:hypothetical protein
MGGRGQDTDVYTAPADRVAYGAKFECGPALWKARHEIGLLSKDGRAKRPTF